MYTNPIRNIHNSRPSKTLAVLLAAAGLTTLGLSLNVQAQGTAPARIAPPATFAAHDGNGDGFISKAEFDTFRQSSQTAGRPMFRAVTFEALDSNRDGKISSEEFAANVATRGAGAGVGAGVGAANRTAAGRGARGAGAGRRAAMRQMPTFADFDLNKDGKITEAEQLKARETRTEQRRAEGRLLRNQANAARFAASDTNRDGSVSPEEFAAHQATRQQSRPANNRK